MPTNTTLGCGRPMRIQGRGGMPISYKCGDLGWEFCHNCQPATTPEHSGSFEDPKCDEDNNPCHALALSRHSEAQAWKRWEEARAKISQLLEDLEAMESSLNATAEEAHHQLMRAEECHRVMVQMAQKADKHSARATRAEKALKEAKLEAENVIKSLVCIGGPLNDNARGFNSSQLKLIFSINEKMERIAAITPKEVEK